LEVTARFEVAKIKDQEVTGSRVPPKVAKIETFWISHFRVNVSQDSQIPGQV
jgi:hypothetical protein